MQQYKKDFINYFWIKETPNQSELELFKKAQKYIKYISWIPGLKMVAVCNSLSMFATKPNWDSDIDIFIVTCPKRLWIVRILSTIIFQILWVRRHWNKIKKRFCLSFFVTEKWMDFSSFAIENDIYLGYWIYYMKPILNKDNTYNKFVEINCSSFWNILENINSNYSLQFLKTYSRYNYKLDKSKLLDLLELILKKTFLPKTLKHKEKLGNPFGLIVTDDILKFHDNDKRIVVRDEIIKNQDL